MEEKNQKEKSVEVLEFKNSNKILILVLFAVLLGIVIKTEAIKKITTGFEDYKLGPAEKFYDINQLEREVSQRQAEGSANQNAQGAGANTNQNQADNENNPNGNESCDVSNGSSCQQ